LNKDFFVATQDDLKYVKVEMIRIKLYSELGDKSPKVHLNLEPYLSPQTAGSEAPDLESEVVKRL